MFTPRRNRLLESLSHDCRETLQSAGKEVDLPVRAQLYRPEEMPQYGYFLTSGIASVVAGLDDGATAEVGLIGNEGLVGAFHLLGPLPPLTDCFMQVAGSGYRIPLPALRKAFQEHEQIRNRVLEFVQQQTMVVSQVAACNKLHDAEPRLARWLLMMHDRTQTSSIKITQEFAAQMLGTRRTTVNSVLGVMHKKGLLEHQRGEIIVADRQLLVVAACECYPMIRRSLESLYGGNGAVHLANRSQPLPS